MIQEKRKAKRWKIYHDARYRRLAEGLFTGCMLCDLSFWGVKISCQEIFKAGEIIEFYANIPDALHPLIIRAKVVYARLVHRTHYEHGLRFIDMKQKDREKIYGYIYKNYPTELEKLTRTGKIDKRGGEEKMLKTAPRDDRRIFDRIAVDLYARYFNSEENKEGYFRVADISAKGMGIVAQERFPRGTHLEIWVNVPEQKTPVYTRGQVVWDRQLGRGYRAGINLEKADFMNCPKLIKGFSI
ncbi:MAG: PilZ domain-containing protein [Candidatus Omnitrophica bacterium]|nr:PilZ domain-containing protein [Candidatus Omnitrophota bacterium]